MWQYYKSTLPAGCKILGLNLEKNHAYVILFWISNYLIIIWLNEHYRIHGHISMYRIEIIEIEKEISIYRIDNFFQTMTALVLLLLKLLKVMIWQNYFCIDPGPGLTLPMLRLLSPKAQGHTIFGKALNPAMLVFIRKLSLNTLRWVPYPRVSVIFLGFLYHFILAKLTTSSIRPQGSK